MGGAKYATEQENKEREAKNSSQGQVEAGTGNAPAAETSENPAEEPAKENLLDKAIHAVEHVAHEVVDAVKSAL